jgi:hypothetical protein
VPAEGPGGDELAQLVPDHIFLNVDWHVPATVVNGDRVPNHVREDRRSARPRPDNALLSQLVHPFDLAQELGIYKRYGPL